MVYLPHWPIPGTLGSRSIDYETVFERMAIVLERLDNPHNKMPPAIHVAGTNGKGSTVSVLAKIFSLSNYRVHTYTSPHLHNCNERIVLNGEKISDGFLFEVMEEVRCVSREVQLTFMEAFTIGAFVAFSKVSADILIVECGMGGRIDATNIIEKKIANVITSISFDHMEYLGNSIERIALEKAMIMRPNIPLIVSKQFDEANNIIKILANDQKINAYFYDEDFGVAINENKEFDFFFQENYLYDLPKPSLEGNHQYVNFSNAIACCYAIKNLFNISQENIRLAISQVKWPSRIERIDQKIIHLFNNKENEIWIDGAHNVAGAASLANWIKCRNDNKKNFVVVGFSRGKCKKEFLNNFYSISKLLALRVNGEPYPEDPKVIRKIALEDNIEIEPFDHIFDIIDYINKYHSLEPVRIVICGSLHLARDVAFLQ